MERYGVNQKGEPEGRTRRANQKTVAKWRKRAGVADLPTGPRVPKSTVLSPEDAAIIVAFRGHTLLPLDDCLDSLQPSIPHLKRIPKTAPHFSEMRFISSLALIGQANSPWFGWRPKRREPLPRLFAWP